MPELKKKYCTMTDEQLFKAVKTRTDPFTGQIRPFYPHLLSDQAYVRCIRKRAIKKFS